MKFRGTTEAGARKRFMDRAERVSLVKQSAKFQRGEPLQPLPKIYHIKGCDQVLLEWDGGLRYTIAEIIP